MFQQYKVNIFKKRIQTNDEVFNINVWKVYALICSTVSLTIVGKWIIFDDITSFFFLSFWKHEINYDQLDLL